MIWDHHDPFYLFAGTDSGSLTCIDVRSPNPLVTYEAHTSALSALALSPLVTGCLITASNDRSVKVWDVRDHSAIQFVQQRLCKIGEIYSVAACPDEPLLFSVGGQFEMKLLNFANDASVTKNFGVGASNSDVAEESGGSPCSSGSGDIGLSSGDENTTGKSLKSENASFYSSSGNSDTDSESCKSSADRRKKKRKKSKSTLQSTSTTGGTRLGLEVQTAAKKSQKNDVTSFDRSAGNSDIVTESCKSDATNLEAQNKKHKKSKLPASDAKAKKKSIKRRKHLKRKCL